MTTPENDPFEDTTFANYDVITANNSRKMLQSGETFENKLIDMRNGRWYQINVSSGASNWTIRNVAFIGRHRHDENVISVYDGSRNGTSRIENLWLADGMQRARNYRSHGQCGIFVHRKHRGTVKIRNVNVQGMPNNGMYANPPIYEGRGEVHVENCYSANNYVSNYRIGTPGSYLRDCVSVNTSEWYNGRGCWLWGQSNDHVDVRRCHFAMNGRHHSIETRTGHSNIYNTQWDPSFRNGWQNSHGGNTHWRGGNGHSPRNFIPEGCPRTAIEAASGEGGAPGPDPQPPEPEPPGEPDPDLPPRTFFVTGEGAYPPATNYEFRADGPIVQSDYNNASIDAEDYVREADDDTGHWIGGGTTANWRDAFRFQGDLHDVEVEGPGFVYVDGQQIDPADYVWEPAPPEEPPEEPDPEPEPPDPEPPEQPIESDPPQTMRRFGSMWSRRDFPVDMEKGEDQFSFE